MIFISFFSSCTIKDVKYHFSEGMRLEKTGHYPDAVKSYLEVLKLDDRHFGGLYNTANLYFLQDKFPDAKKYYIRAILEKTNFAPAYFGLGLTYHKLKDGLRAREAFRLATVFDKKLAPAHIMRAWSFYEEARYAESIKELQLCINTSSTNVAALYNLGWIHYHQSEYSNAIEPLQSVYRLDPDDYQAAVLLGKTLLKTGNIKEAGALLSAVRKRNKTHIHTRMLAAEFSAYNNDSAGAQRLLKRITEDYPDNFQAWFLRGEVLFKQQKWEDALQSFTVASSLDYSNVRPRLFRVDIYLQQKKTALALKDLYALQKGHPRDPGVLGRLLQLQYTRREYDRVVNTGKRLLKQKPDDQSSLFFTGMSLLKVEDPSLRDPKLAITMLWKIYPFYKKDAELLMALHDALKEAGDLKRLRVIKRLLP